MGTSPSNYLAGHCVDTDDGCLSVAERRIAKFKNSIDYILKGDRTIVKERDLASIRGQIMSLTPCIGHARNIMSRLMYSVLIIKYHGILS